MRSLLFLLVIITSITSFGLDQFNRSRTIKKIIKKSDAIVRGKVLDIELGESKSFIYLKVIEGTGIKAEEIKDTFVKVYFSTKKVNDQIEKEIGLDFQANEEVMVFLTKIKGRYWLYQEALGKYKVERIAGKKYIVSSVIKRNLDGGEIPLANFYKIVEFVKSVPMKWWENNQFVNKSFLEKSLMTTDISNDSIPSSGRGIASLSTFEDSDAERAPVRLPANEPEESGSGPFTYWLVVLLAVIGGTVRLMWKNS